MKAKYIGIIDLLKGETFDVVKTVSDGGRLPSGEINQSGMNMYVCRRGNGFQWRFREDEVELF